MDYIKNTKHRCYNEIALPQHNKHHQTNTVGEYNYGNHQSRKFEKRVHHI